MKYVVNLNGKNYEVEVTEQEAVVTNITAAAAAPAPVAAPVAAPAAAPAPVAQAVSAEGTTIPSPMPGTILNVNVTVGQAVKEGDVLIVLEAMKMENEIVAPEDGTIASINVSQGASVNSGDVLATLN